LLNVKKKIILIITMLTNSFITLQKVAILKIINMNEEELKTIVPQNKDLRDVQKEAIQFIYSMRINELEKFIYGENNTDE